MPEILTAAEIDQFIEMLNRETDFPAVDAIAKENAQLFADRVLAISEPLPSVFDKAALLVKLSRVLSASAIRMLDHAMPGTEMLATVAVFNQLAIGLGVIVAQPANDIEIADDSIGQCQGSA